MGCSKCFLIIYPQKLVNIRTFELVSSKMAEVSEPLHHTRDNFPAELIGSITQCWEEGFASRKNPRLTSKYNGHAVPRYLKRNLLLHYYPGSWEKVNLIASCPTLTYYVRTLRLASLEWRPDPEDLEDWKRFVLKNSWSNFKSCVSLIGDLSNLAETLRNCYERYSEWTKGGT